jgi:hypothetical protein
MEPLVKILRRALNDDLEEGWLYLPKEVLWQLDTPGVILNVDGMEDAELDDDGEPVVVKRHNLASTLDNQTIEDIVRSFRNLEDPPSDDGLLEAFTYYYDHDAFLPRRGFVPLPAEEAKIRRDRDFYDSLGDESTKERCKHQGCNRGKVNLSLYCRIHHFEMVEIRPCPFTH